VRVLIPPPVRVPLVPAVALATLAALGGGRSALDQTALPSEDPRMRHQLAAAFLLMSSCKQEPPRPEPGSAQEGEACDDAAPADEQLCAAGLACFSVGALDFEGYCAPACKPGDDCAPIEGHPARCVEDGCAVECEGPGERCPDIYDVPLYCNGSSCALDMSEDSPTAG